MKKFNNNPNRFITSDSDSGWLSRSCVVVALVEYDDKILCVKRGNDMTQKGKWCMPCGYLDYNETLRDAVYREIYEETGIYVLDYSHDFMGPVSIDSYPIGKKQNITFQYRIKLKNELDPDMSVVDKGETTDCKWIHKDDIKNYTFAFNHNTIIDEYFKRHKIIR